MKIGRHYFVLFLLSMLMGVLPLHAQETFLALIPVSNNTGDASTEWTIHGERTLVMNGFDLSALNLPLPFTVEAVSIALTQVTSAPVGIIVYQDPNGGPPIDAQVIARTEVTISQPGVARFVLPRPAIARSRIIWVGFYLPPGFTFQADTSGPSVLTYWVYTPGQEINTDNLDRAAILGPADGSAPVNVNMGGIARITAEVRGPVAQSAGFTPETAPLGRQIIGAPEVDFSPMQVYPYCGNLYYDREDIGISANGVFLLSCRADIDQHIPGLVRNMNKVAEGIATFEKGGYVYDVFTGNPEATTAPGDARLRVPVTHCMIPAPEHLGLAIMAVAYGAPKQWDILPTMRYASFICAEVTHVGLVTYLIPRTVDQVTPLSANLFLINAPNFGDPNALGCAASNVVQYRIRNEGFQTTPPTTVIIRIVHVRTGTVVTEFGENFPPIEPGATNDRDSPVILPDRFRGEQYRVSVTVDPEGRVPEMNEGDNESSFTFTLLQTNRCK